MMRSSYHIVFSYIFLYTSAASRIGFYDIFANSRFFAHASLDLHLTFSSVRGWQGIGEVLTSIRIRLVSSISLISSYICLIFISIFIKFLPTIVFSAYGSFDLHLSFSSVRRRGLMTSMRLRFISSISFIALFLKCCGFFYEALLPFIITEFLNRQPCKKNRNFENFQIKTQEASKIIKNKRRKI